MHGLVYSPDNGGYLGNGGDDTPLRGGKFSDFQGGVKVAAFASGGLIPPAMRGTNVSGYLCLPACLFQPIMQYASLAADCVRI